MARKYKIHEFDPNKPGLEPPKKAPKSQLWEVKAFPQCRAGYSGPNGFPAPASVWPPFDKDPKPGSGSGNFQLWVNYYAGVVGYYVSILNGLQFDLEKHGTGNGAKNMLKLFAEKIDEFAKALHIYTPAELAPADPHGQGKPNDPKDPLADYAPNPRELVWPLCGRYYFRYRFRRIENLIQQFNYFADLELHFECDPLTYLCTNCGITLRVTDTLLMLPEGGLGPADPDYISSSSSYVATSSSSSS